MYLIFTHDPILKCLSSLQCILDMLIFAQGISTIKAAEQDQYALILLNRDRIKSTIPIHTEEHLLTKETLRDTVNTKGLSSPSEGTDTQLTKPSITDAANTVVKILEP